MAPSTAAALPVLLVAVQLGLRAEGTTTASWLRSLAPFLVAATVLAALVIWRHRENLARTFGRLPPRPGGPYDRPAGPPPGAG